MKHELRKLWGCRIQLQENEQVVRIIKRHPLSLIGRIVGVALLLILGVALWLWLLNLNSGLELIIDILMTVGALVAIINAGAYWYRYENDLWIVTNERLIDSTKTTPFNQEIKTAIADQHPGHQHSQARHLPDDLRVRRRDLPDRVGLRPHLRVSGRGETGGGA
jgi:hypothetical protein